MEEVIVSSVAKKIPKTKEVANLCTSQDDVINSTTNIYFDPNWRDDVFDPQALEIQLCLPEKSLKKGKIWIDTKFASRGYIFGKPHEYASERKITAVLKPSDMGRFYQVANQDGEILENDEAAMSFMFPPKSWMTDSGEERCTMFAAAKLARGRVLVGGLGLAIYPQFIHALNRPVDSITIIEHDSEVIRLVSPVWPPDNLLQTKRVSIIEGDIEKYLLETNENFDTIFMDTWDDADPRFLAHINYLIELASRRCSPRAQIQCWGYARMIQTFVEDMKNLTKANFPLHEHHLDPVLNAYVEWMDKKKESLAVANVKNPKTSYTERNEMQQNSFFPTDEEIEHVAREVALKIKKPISEYDRLKCFTGYGTSLLDAYRNMALSRKDESDIV